jgi:hypothetical protein
VRGTRGDFGDYFAASISANSCAVRPPKIACSDWNGWTKTVGLLLAISTSAKTGTKSIGGRFLQMARRNETAAAAARTGSGIGGISLSTVNGHEIETESIIRL